LQCRSRILHKLRPPLVPRRHLQRPTSHHHKQHHSEGEDINSLPIIFLPLPGQLRCHVRVRAALRAEGLACPENLDHTHVADLYGEVGADEAILKFEIAMRHGARVEVLDGVADLGEHLASEFVGEAVCCCDEVEKVTVRRKLGTDKKLVIWRFVAFFVGHLGAAVAGEARQVWMG